MGQKDLRFLVITWYVWDGKTTHASRDIISGVRRALDTKKNNKIK